MVFVVLICRYVLLVGLVVKVDLELWVVELV